MSLNDEPNWDLLADLARVLRRYPTHDWEALVTWLQDDAKRSRFLALISELVRVRREQASSAPRAGSGGGQIIRGLASSEPEKARILSELRTRLLSRELLPTAYDIRAFAEAIGSEVPRSVKKREQAISVLLRALARLPQDELVKAIAEAPRRSRDLGGEYTRWVELILGRRAANHG